MVFIYPDDQRFNYMKRIVAMPGDRVEIRNNVVSANNRPLDQRPIEKQPALNFSLEPDAGIVLEQIGHRCYPIIVDNIHPQNMAPLVVPHGQCFVLGDNRRLPAGDAHPFDDLCHLGPIPLADIKGRLEYIYWPALSWDRFGKY